MSSSANPDEIGPIAAFVAAEALPPAYADTVARIWAPLAAHLAGLHKASARPLLIGINGAQGTGKTTACRFLEFLLRDRHGLRAATLSLDDVYLTRADRAALAATIHPLLATRGPPGTHDLALAETAITRLLTGTGPVAIPRFDKAIDDRAPASDWPLVAAPLDILLFEGWCMGATPQADAALATPQNALEAEEDRDCLWRRHVNTALATGYAGLFARLDQLIMLQAPNFASVRRWRALQEQKLIAARGTGMEAPALDRFLQHYERLTRHMLESLPARADIVVPLDPQHNAGAILFKDRAGII
jgi:D-glycerate 3-kinase